MLKNRKNPYNFRGKYMLSHNRNGLFHQPEQVRQVKIEDHFDNSRAVVVTNTGSVST